MAGAPSAEVLSATRMELLSSIAGSGRPAILLEPLDLSSRAYCVTQASGGTFDASDGLAFSQESALVRWLRVNNEYLPVPDRDGVFAELSPRDQQQLARWGVGGCVPLVHDWRLVGWIAMVGTDAIALEVAARPLVARLPGLAGRLNDAQVQWHEARRSESVAQSNRLSLAGQLAASVAHEIRNPLAAIRSTVQMLRDDDVPEVARLPLMSAVLSEVDRVNRTLVEMLALGRRRATTLELCDLDVVVDQAIAFCHGYAQRSQLSINRSGQTRTIEGDAFELRQVIVNLLLNACQASPSGGAVRIETGLHPIDAERSDVFLRVEDQGAGIAPQNLAHVFEPFFTTKVDGGGLGLAICRDTILRHGGKIELASNPGAGTTVTVYLPRV